MGHSPIHTPSRRVNEEPFVSHHILGNTMEPVAVELKKAELLAIGSYPWE